MGSCGCCGILGVVIGDGSCYLVDFVVLVCASVIMCNKIYKRMVCQNVVVCRVMISRMIMVILLRLVICWLVFNCC